MTLALRSFRTRLVLGAVLWISLGFVVSWGVLSNLLRAHAQSEFVSELDHHATELAQLVQMDRAGSLTLRAPLSDSRFSTDGSGHYWQISLPDGLSLASATLGGFRLPLKTPQDGMALTETAIAGPFGQAMLLSRAIRIGSASGPEAKLAIAIDTDVIAGYVGGLEDTLAIAMACLAAGLVLSAVAQISFALRPLARIDTALQDVKRGSARRLPTDLPTEVKPLVENLNALLDKNEAMVQRARLQAGNLAHALKTSLAHLEIEADRLTGQSQSAEVIQRHCDILRREIDHQLARARATASRAGVGQSCNVGQTIASVVAAVQKLPAYRHVSMQVDPTHADALVACGPEDLQEVLGNLIDNAAKWARCAVLVSTRIDGDKLVIRIEDDGPGMPPDQHERAFKAGERLDETAPGSGLGLAIARDVVGLYDGRMWIETSRFGGALVAVELDLIR